MERTIKKRGKNTKKAKNTFLSRVRNFIILSLIMMLIGGTADRFRTEIFYFCSSGYKPVLEKIINLSGHVDKESISQTFSSQKSITNSNAKVSVPASNCIVKRKYYTLGYNEDTEQANWVSYNLTKDMILNRRVRRTDDFRPDPFLKTGSADLNDYRKSGYDRGHLCPAAAMAFNKTAMSETFYMSNMSPQKPEFNRGVWKKLEKKVRDWAVKNHGISVVTGPIFYNNKKHKEIGRNGVDIPDAYFKVILDYRKPDVKAIGFILPNRRVDKPLSCYTVPVNNIERITGFNFFPQLPDDIEERLESHSDYSRWI